MTQRMGAAFSQSARISSDTFLPALQEHKSWHEHALFHILKLDNSVVGLFILFISQSLMYNSVLAAQAHASMQAQVAGPSQVPH